MVLKHCFPAALALVCFLSLAVAKDTKPGSVSGRLFIRTPDGKDVPGYKAKAYLLYVGSGKGQGKLEIKQSCVNSRCTKRAFVDGREVDITGLQNDSEIYEAAKTPSDHYSDEFQSLISGFFEHSDEWMREELEKLFPGKSRIDLTFEESKRANCFVKIRLPERALVATEKWASDRQKGDQFFTMESAEDGRFTFTAVPEGNYSFYAIGSAGDWRVVWSAFPVVKSGAVTAVDVPKVDDACPPL